MIDESSQKLISCRVCGVIMVKLGRDICSKCFQKEEELFQRVKNFLRANPGITVKEVAQAMNCPEKHIEYFITSGRLERVGVKIAHPCQICQKTIVEGLICPECKRNLKDQVAMLKNAMGIKDDNEKQ